MSKLALMIVATISMCLAHIVSASAPGKEAAGWTDSFQEDKSELVATGKNPFFILLPGYYLIFEGTEKGRKAELRITVLDETKRVDGVETRVIEERETMNGKVVEISRNFFAISKRTNSVYYFGEDSKEYKDGRVVGQEGSWEAGVKGARFGLMMPGNVLLGSRYYQEVAPKVAMDRAENLSTSETVQVSAGKYSDCIKAEETTPLEPKNKEYKFYAPGIGLIRDGDLQLTRYGYANH